MASTTVNVTELRSRLRTYISRARNGEEILIRDRKLAVARLVPLSQTDDVDETLREMAARGLVRLSEKRLDLKAFFALPTPRIPLNKLRSAIEAERDED